MHVNEEKRLITIDNPRQTSCPRDACAPRLPWTVFRWKKGRWVGNVCSTTALFVFIIVVLRRVILCRRRRAFISQAVCYGIHYIRLQLLHVFFPSFVARFHQSIEVWATRATNVVGNKPLKLTTFDYRDNRVLIVRHSSAFKQTTACHRMMQLTNWD